MKTHPYKIARQKGSSTLEMLIAFALLIMGIVAVILIVFGNQSVSVDTETNQEALYKAEQMMEQVRASSTLDFALVNPTATTTETSGPLTYTKKLDVGQIDFFTKQATTTIKWKDEGRPQTIELTTLITNPESASGGSAGGTCSSILSGDWTNPQMSPPIDVGPSSSSGNPVTDVNANDKKLYVTTDNTHGGNDDFYVYDYTADPKNPVLVASLETNTVNAGLRAIAVSSTTAGHYAYVANAHDPNFQTCTPGKACSQMQVIDVTSAATPILKVNFLLPTSTPPMVLGNMSSTNQAVGQSLFYGNNYLYLGLTKTASGPEFNIIDVTNPLAPFYVGSYSVGRTINRIFVKGKYAYLATDDNTAELTVLDISNPALPTFAGKYNAPGASGFGYGKAIYKVGDTMYFGRSYVSTAPEFTVLNVANPYAISLLNSRDIGPNSGNARSVNGIIVRDYLTFMTVDDSFQIWNSSNPSSMTLVRSFLYPGTNASGVSTDCEGNYLYVGSYRDSNDKGELNVIYAGP